MRNRLDNILLGILWLLAATLGTSFWFNTKYGFNIFSAPHWQYLAHLQASKIAVMPSFYISLGVSVFITIFGLYFLIQPKIRKIVLPIIKTKKSDTTPKPQPAEPARGTPQPSATNAVDTAPITTPQPVSQPQVALSGMQQRPPRLNLPKQNSYATVPSAPTTIGTPSVPDADINALREIFSQNGYTVKKTPYINRWQPNLMAIGTNEVLWIGAIGATTDQVKKAVDKLNQVFSDTLDDVYIDVNGFSVNAPDAQTATDQDVLLFDTIDELGAFMSEHPNPTPNPDEKENFDAYSEYIDTVIGYIGNL